MNSALPYKSPLISDNSDPGINEYRVVSKSAICCLLFALMGLAAFINEVFVILPAIAIGFGIVSMLNFKRYPGEFLGRIPMQLGLLLGVACFIGSIAKHVYVFNTEVPEGYERISFAMLRENPKKKLTYSEAAKNLNNKKVFIKGYVRPGDKRKNLRQFILVGDFGSCCFGGNPKISEVVAITIGIPDKTVNHGYSKRSIAGTFHFIEEKALTDESEVPVVHYHIEADYIK